MTSTNLIYSYARCSTCRKALLWLKENQISHEVIDIVNDPPDHKTLRMAFDQYDNRKALFNTSGQSYRALGAVVVNGMTDEEALNALEADGKLIKRPFLVTPEGRVFVGFKPDIWNEQLLN